MNSTKCSKKSLLIFELYMLNKMIKISFPLCLYKVFKTNFNFTPLYPFTPSPQSNPPRLLCGT